MHKGWKINGQLWDFWLWKYWKRVPSLREKKRKIYSKCMLGCFMFCSFSDITSVGYVLSSDDSARMQIFFLVSLYHLLSGQISRDKCSLVSPSQSFWLKILRTLFVYSPFLISPEIFVHYCCFENLCLKTPSVVFYLSVIPQADSGIYQEHCWS